MPVTVAIPMDGCHFPQAHRAAMPDPETAIPRWAVAFTFDGGGFYTLMEALAHEINPDRTIFAPSFNHTTKDPVADAIPIAPNPRIVVLEGNCVALNQSP